MQYEVKMTSITLSLLLIHLLKRAWKNERAKCYIFRKSSLNLTFGQGDCRKSDFAKLK